MTLRPGALHLGYIRPQRGQPGIWTVRTYVGKFVEGKRGGKTPYRIARIKDAVADDYEDANNSTVLSFEQAQDIALAPPEEEQSGGPLTVTGAMTAYVKFIRATGREEAAAEAEQRISKHVTAPLGALPVAALKPEQLRGWLADLAKKLRRRDDDDAVRRSRASANRILNTLRAALNYAYVEGLVPTDSAWRRRLAPFKGVGVARKRYLTHDEARRLINAAHGDFRTLVQAALQTGARYGELTRLKVHDFDPDSGTVSVAKSKSGKSRRVHLTDEGAEFFQAITAGRRGDELMLRHAGGKPWLRSDQQNRMRLAVEAARLTPMISFHGMRHTYASLALMGGVPLQVVAENLGHADTRMCERHYGHLSAGHKRDAIRAGAPRFGIVQASNVKPLR